MNKRGSFSSFTNYTLPFDLVLIAAGLFAALWRPSPKWVERAFTNGYYPQWEGFWASITPHLPFALGDVVVLVGVLLIVTVIVLTIVDARKQRSWRTAGRNIIGIGAILGLYSVWFYAGWGWGYDRAPVQTRVAYDERRVNPREIEALRSRIIAQINELAPIAHRVHDDDNVNLDMLRNAWIPVVLRLGDTWIPSVHAAKPTLAGWFMDRSGTSGFTNPFTLETQLAPDLLWFERPFSQAHEWSHVAGFNREDEANYIAAVTCLRDPDPVAQYSGALELFLYLPPLRHYPHRMFVPQVWQDFAAIRKRNRRFVNLSVSRLSWRVYNSYLKSNHIASGVQNYDEVTRLMAGIPLDAQGLPAALPADSSESTPPGNR